MALIAFCILEEVDTRRKIFQLHTSTLHVKQQQQQQQVYSITDEKLNYHTSQ